MHYPFWYVEGLTSPLLIALIATVHVFVSLYAVGGGIFLAWETRYAYRANNREYLNYLKQHAWFFVLLTVAFGAITGVGIWWTIGLASPLPTEFLIHTFVFGWAMEYVFFILEIVSAFIFFYAWGKLSPRVHQQIGWIYAISAWVSLVIITGVTGFMLNPGDWQGNFWRAFLNPQTIPQILARTGAALLLATLYVYLHAGVKAQPAYAGGLCELVARRSARPAMVGTALIIVGGIGWYLTLPFSAKAALTGAAALNLMMMLIFVLTAVVFFVFYWSAYRQPICPTPAFAALFLIIGLIITGEAEFVREAVRKPYVIYGEVYSHNVYPSELTRLQKDGFLEGGVWTRHYVTQRFPELLDGQGKIDEAKISTLPQTQQVELGKMLFMYHCASCHSPRGFSGMREALPGWKSDMLEDLILNMDRYHFFMPPWSGTREEATALRKYLETLATPHPIKRHAMTRNAVTKQSPAEMASLRSQ